MVIIRCSKDTYKMVCFLLTLVRCFVYNTYAKSDTGFCLVSTYSFSNNSEVDFILKLSRESSSFNLAAKDITIPAKRLYLYGN